MPPLPHCYLAMLKMITASSLAFFPTELVHHAVLNTNLDVVFSN
jgi:hypothetical protein